jgi:L-asparaginase
MKNLNSSVLLIYTGGTIGMMEDPLTGELKPVDFASLRDYIPELNRFKLNISWHALEVPIDSSNAKLGEKL